MMSGDGFRPIWSDLMRICIIFFSASEYCGVSMSMLVVCGVLLNIVEYGEVLWSIVVVVVGR